MATQDVINPVPSSQPTAEQEYDFGAFTEAELDEEITRIRAKIHDLNRRRKLLSSTLLSLSSTQSIINKHHSDPSSLASSSMNHATTNLHRIALSATSFSFEDPSDVEGLPLLGVRIDICRGDGQFVKPYYLLLQRVGRDQQCLKIHRHTIPPFIPLKDMEERWLPDMDGQGVTVNRSRYRKRQNLQRLVRELREELVSWHARIDAIDYVRKGMGLSKEGEGETMDVQGSSPSRTVSGIKSIAPTSLEARYVRIEWNDGTVGRFKLSNDGIIERAVVLGDDGRQKRLEDMLMEGPARIENLTQQLTSSSVT